MASAERAITTRRPDHPVWRGPRPWSGSPSDGAPVASRDVGEVRRAVTSPITTNPDRGLFRQRRRCPERALAADPSRCGRRGV